MTVVGSAFAGGSLDADRNRPRAGEVEQVEVDVGPAPVEGNRLMDDRERDGDVRLDDAELAGGDRDPGRVAGVDRVAMPKSMSRRLHCGPTTAIPYIVP